MNTGTVGATRNRTDLFLKYRNHARGASRTLGSPSTDRWLASDQTPKDTDCLIATPTSALIFARMCAQTELKCLEVLWRWYTATHQPSKPGKVCHVAVQAAWGCVFCQTAFTCTFFPIAITYATVLAVREVWRSLNMQRAGKCIGYAVEALSASVKMSSRPACALLGVSEAL